MSGCGPRADNACQFKSRSDSPAQFAAAVWSNSPPLAEEMRTQRSVAIFDLGGLLFDGNPRHLYRKLFDGD